MACFMWHCYIWHNAEKTPAGFASGLEKVLEEYSV